MTDMLRNRIRTVKQTVEVNAFKFGIAFGQRLLQQITAADQILEPAMPRLAMISRTSSATKKK